MSETSQETVKFNSCGDTVVGILTRPKSAKGNVPLVIMAGGRGHTEKNVMPY